MTFEKRDYIKYRPERTDEALAEAKQIAKMQHWNSVANRLYYACFYAVNVLMINNDLNAKTHAGVRSMFHELLNSKFTNKKDLGKLYSELFDLRNKGDYMDLVVLEQVRIEPMIAGSERFIEEIKNMIDLDES